MPAAGEPLGDAEYALGVIDGLGELADACGHRAHPARRVGQPQRFGDQLRVLLEDARAEQVPLARRSRGSDRRAQRVLRGCRTGARSSPRPPRPGGRSCRAPERCTGRAGAVTACDVPQERLRVPACRRENGDDMAGMRLLNVIARAAVVPDQPAGLRGDAPGRAHEDRRIGAEQDVTASGDARQHRLERLPVAAVVLQSPSAAPSRDRHASSPRAAWRPNCANLPDRDRQAPMRRSASWRLTSCRPRSRTYAGRRRPPSPAPRPAVPRCRRQSADAEDGTPGGILSCAPRPV